MTPRKIKEIWIEQGEVARGIQSRYGLKDGARRAAAIYTLIETSSTTSIHKPDWPTSSPRCQTIPPSRSRVAALELEGEAAARGLGTEACIMAPGHASHPITYSAIPQREDHREN